MPTREKGKTFHGRYSSESSPLNGRLDRRRGGHRQIHDLHDKRKREPVLTGVPLSLSTRCVVPGSDSLLPPSACDPASLSAWSSRRALAFRYCFCFPCPPRLKSVCTLIWRGFVSAFLGRKMRSTPSRLCAMTFPVSTVVGSVNLLAKLP